jgi:hypothetical protein
MVFAFEPAHACLPSRRCLDYCIGDRQIPVSTGLFR